MIWPRASDLLRNVDATLATKVEPSLQDVSSRSAMVTIRHILRLILVRVEQEGQVLSDDIAALNKLLPKVQTYLSSLEDGQASVHAAMISDAILRARGGPARYPSLDVLAEWTGILREALFRSLKYMQSIRAEHARDERYREVRCAIRAYMAWQVAEEAKLVAPAFYSRGPRR
jgi:hypothetical protein